MYIVKKIKSWLVGDKRMNLALKAIRAYQQNSISKDVFISRLQQLNIDRPFNHEVQQWL